MSDSGTFEMASQPPGYRYNFDSLDEYLETGEKLGQEGRLAEGADVLREATNRYPESATAFYDLGVALFLELREEHAHLELWEDLAENENVAEECVYALESAIERDPKLTEAFTNLGTILALRGRRDEAIAAWERSLALNPNQPDVLEELDLYRNKLSAPPEEDELAQP